MSVTTERKPSFETMGNLAKKYPKLHNLHDTLWQIFVNRALGIKVITFVALAEGAVGVACANEPGYVKTTILVDDGVKYDELDDWVHDINKTVFDQSEMDSILIVASSMKKGR